jgi:hypothetical protein
MRRFACILALLGTSACALPVPRLGPIAVGCITVEREGSARHAYDSRWIARRPATRAEVDAELRRWPPSAAEASRAHIERVAGMVAVFTGAAAVPLGGALTAGAFTHDVLQPYGSFLIGGGLAVAVTASVLLKHAGVHDRRGYDLYNQAATERAQCPVGAAARP